MVDLHLNYSTEQIARRLLKYASRRTARIILENRSLRWSTPGTLNDPYDMQFDLHIDVDREAVKRLTVEKLWDAYYGPEPAPAGNRLGLLIRAFRGRFPQLPREEFERQFGEVVEEGLAAMERALPRFQEEIRAHVSRSKILCLTEVPDSAPMWAYYAEDHQGLVLQFRSVAELDSPWVTARPIQYFANMPRLLDADFLADMLSGRVSMEPLPILDRLVYTKSNQWAHEREWRIFSGDGRNPEAPFEDIPFHRLELEAVILGCRMPTEDRRVFSDLTARLYPHAQIFDVERAARDFHLNIVPVLKRGL